MKEYLQALLNEDIYYDEANPKYRCFLNLYHVAKATKLIAMLHTAILFGCFISYFPYSFIGLPAITTVLIATVHALICENSLTLLPFYIYLLFIIVFCAILGVTVFVFTIINPHFLLLQLGYRCKLGFINS